MHPGFLLAYEEMDGDEVLALVVFLGLAIVGLVKWYPGVVGRKLAGRRTPHAFSLAITPILCLAFLLVVLLNWSDKDVRRDPRYILLFLFGGVAFMGLFLYSMPIVGHSIRLDLLSNRNPASAIVAVGAMIGVNFAYSLANIGTGPTIWTTIGPAILASLTLLALWLLVELVGGACEAITIDRDSASALRLAGFLAGAGLILGRAVAGDWKSSDDTLADFIHQGYPAAILAIVAAIVQRMLRPTPSRPRPSLIFFGLMPSLVFLMAAALWVAHLGKW